MKSTILKKIDFEALGYQTMAETGDEAIATRICENDIHALALELKPKLLRLFSDIEQTKCRRQSLWSHLYDRDTPVSDAAILGLRIAAGILAALILISAAASIAGHVTTFYLSGAGMAVSLVIGVPLTGLALASGYQLFEKILRRHWALEATVVVVAALLAFWGFFQMTQTRGSLMEKLTTSTATNSFVEDNTAEDVPEEPTHSDDSGERRIKNLMGSAMVKIMLAADIFLGLFFGLFVKIWTDEDFVAWHDMKKTEKSLGTLEERSNEHLSTIEIAKKRCTKGILSAKHRQQKKSVPYHQVVLILLIIVFLALPPAFAQTINHHEGHLIDVSGSVGKGGVNSDLFREYLFGVKKLLLTEPPNSRVWVSIITTESFGSTRSLVKGWTPDAKGVFTDDLNRARRQLAGNFESKSAGLSPTAGGTDIIGGLWQLKTSFESGSKGSSDSVSRTIWIFSDMVNESANFNMPALLPTGPEKMMERAKANGLVVPLSGYRVYVVGASQAGLSPQAWNALKTFWTLYFRQAGAELALYSAECGVERQ